MASLIQMMGEPIRDPDWTDALEAFTQATKARDKAAGALERAEQLMQQREGELRAVYERLTSPSAPGGTGTKE